MSDNKKTILIIEDNELNREFLINILEDYKCLEAENGKVGLEILKNHADDISLILLDVQMPVMNGYEFLNEFSLHDMYKSIPVIVITGSKISEEEKCLQIGASDFITKPYIPSVVLKRVEALIRLRESISLLNEVKYDKLTKTYTSNVFTHYFSELLKTHPRRKYTCVLINIKSFKRLNDLYGEEKCNEVLVSIASTMRSVFDNDILYGRFSSDRFAFVFESKSHDYNKLISKLKKQIYDTVNLKYFSINFAVYENVHGKMQVRTILNSLYYIINSISNQYNVDVGCFTQKDLEELEYSYFVIENMVKGLDNNEFKVFYQPKHNAKTKELCGAEALVRWNHPSKGLIPPSKFVSIFEQNGFVTKIDLFILNEVCKNLREWIDKGFKVCPVSVNLSRKDLMQIEDFSIFDQTLNKYNIDKKLIHFEITESLCEYGDDILEKVRIIHNMGYLIEIDDFGNGYSSLGIIADIPMDYIKLDMTFAQHLEKQKEVVKTIISMAHAMGVKTIAEGVETESQLSTLKDLKCDSIQGYYFSKPIPHDDFEKYIKKLQRS